MEMQFRAVEFCSETQSRDCSQVALAHLSFNYCWSLAKSVTLYGSFAYTACFEEPLVTPGRAEALLVTGGDGATRGRAKGGLSFPC